MTQDCREFHLTETHEAAIEANNDVGTLAFRSSGLPQASLNNGRKEGIEMRLSWAFRASVSFRVIFI